MNKEQLIKYIEKKIEQEKKMIENSSEAGQEFCHVRIRVYMELLYKIQNLVVNQNVK